MKDELIVTDLYDAQQANMDFLVVPAAAFLKQPITSFYVFGFDQNIPKVRESKAIIIYFQKLWSIKMAGITIKDNEHIDGYICEFQSKSGAFWNDERSADQGLC